MKNSSGLTRRRFLKVSSGAAGGLVIGFYLPGGGRLADAAKGASASEAHVNAWLRIAPDNTVTIVVSSSEMGQGVYTAMPMLVAEELEVDWQQVRAEMAPADPTYNNRFFGMQGTGGSTSIRQGFDYLRQAGASAREVLRQAAANRWAVPLERCVAANGSVKDTESEQSATYGELAADAANLDPPADLPLKPAAEWKILGKPTRRLDTPAKTRGQATFGIDVQVPNLQVATLAICPVFGGKLASVDEKPALAIPGVSAVVPVDDAVMVVADGYWNARRGLMALDPRWDEGVMAEADDASIRARFVAGLEGGMAPAEVQGDAPAVIAESSTRLEVDYAAPFLAHATMEPMNATAHVRADGADVWAPTQAQGPTQGMVAGLLGMEPAQVQIHTTFLGGGFGRRFELDFIKYAVLASQAVGTPVKVVWSREQDTQHDYYRPAAIVRMAAALGADGWPEALHAKVAAPSIFSRLLPQFVKDGVDPSSVEGIIEQPYAIPNRRVDYALIDSGVPVGFWRSVGHSQNAYVREAFIDELAHAAGIDPLDYRLHMLQEKPRHTAVLRKVAEMAEWGSPAPSGRSRGLALHESFGSIVAEVAEVSTDSGQVRVHQVWCVMDCGIVVNPDTVEAQLESGIIYGLTAALFGEINIEKGRVKQSNFPDYPVVTMANAPRIHTHVIQSAEAPGGVGEPSTPPIAPAVVNAVFAATGKPIRNLPIRL